MRKSDKTVKNIVSPDTPSLSEKLAERTEKTETISTKLALINDIANMLSDESGIEIYLYNKSMLDTTSLFVGKKYQTI